jgi:hypothetical protein
MQGVGMWRLECHHVNKPHKPTGACKMNRSTIDAILSIDLGKHKRVACILEESSGECCITSFATSRVAERVWPRKPRFLWGLLSDLGAHLHLSR